MRLIENSTTRNLFDSLRESESIPSMKDDNFEDLVKRDFRLFLMDKYGDELYKDVTEDDINEYFTGMFYDIWDNDDLDSANAAEDIIRAEYHLSDKVNESVEEHDLSKDLFGDEAANRMSQKEKDLERDLQYVRDIIAGKTVIDDKYHEELSLDTAKAWLKKDFVYVNGLSVYSPDEINKRLADEYPDIFGVNESVIEPVEGKQDYELDDYADKLQQELKSIYNDDEVNALRFEILDLLNKKERANNRASGNGLKYNDKLKELIKKAESYLNESDKSLNEDSKIWSNTGMEDYYSNLSREEMIQEIKDNGWDEEEINGKPILDADDEELRDFLTPYDIDLDYEDYENSILPMIENQCYGDYIVLTGIAANWRGKGEACKAIKLSELENYLMPNYDSHTVLYCDNQDNLYYTEATHDTPMGGTQMYLYGFLDETSYDNAEVELQKIYEDENFDMYYFCDYLGYKEAEQLINSGLLKPIKRDPQYVGRVDESHKLELNKLEKLEEAKKPKKSEKENKRVLMQQGNVTCVEENAKYKVFENEQDNLVEYDNKDEAMKDALNRCGVNPDNDLKEKE